MVDDTGQERLGLLLAMVFVAWADGSLAEEERTLIQEEARDQGLDEDQQRRLLEAILTPPSLESVASLLATPGSRKAAATAAYITALADKVLTFSELDAFDRLCERLSLSAEDKEEIRAFGDREMRCVKSGNWHDGLLLERMPLG